MATYSRRVGRSEIDPETWRFCIAFNLFKIAAILQGIMKRALEGSASNASADNTESEGWAFLNPDIDRSGWDSPAFWGRCAALVAARDPALFTGHLLSKHDLEAL